MKITKQQQIVEIGFEITSQEDYDFLERILFKLGYRFYVEPINNFASLEDLECQCEGK